MSRICVKNLPKYIDRDGLRELFSQKGEVTQVMIMLTEDGKSRQFGFVGFKTECEATEAIKYFNNTFVGTRKITCEFARKIGDPNIPRPWSRHSSRKISSPDASRAQIEKTHNAMPKNPKTSDSRDSQLEEFLEVMQPRAKSKLWANDTASVADGVQDEKAFDGDPSPSKVGRKKLEKRVPELPCKKGKQSESLHEDMSDIDYLKSRKKKNWSDSETDDDDGDDDAGDNDGDDCGILQNDQAVVKSDVGSEKFKRDISIDEGDAETGKNETPSLLHNDGRLFVHDLLHSTSEDELLELFKQFGDVTEVHIVLDKETKRSKGMAYVRYAEPISAERALNELRGSIFHGRLLEIQLAKPQPFTAKLKYDAAFQNKRSFKENRAEQRKASELGGDTRAWNTLFIRSDTVVEDTSRRLGISKSDLLDRETENPAVNAALGETQVIADTKKALSNAGINVAALEEYASKSSDNTNRSGHVILVKNLPYSSSERDLADMFGKFGSLEKIILPPTKALALVIFLEAAEARVAFKSLAYRRYKDAPLYLEWAPGNILSPNSTSNRSHPKSAVGEHIINNVVLEKNIQRITEEEIDPDRNESRTLFVKNLNFKTTEESLKRHFSDKMNHGCINSVKVKMHIKNGKNLSMGFGFAEFDSIETAAKICVELQETIVDGHALILQPCHLKNDSNAPKRGAKDDSLTKIIVRNVAFEATEKDLRQLFSPFGQIKRLRLPRKFDKHRGFAFVEFVTKQEARNAMEALSSTHLYGRHLVLERAKEGESLEELREKAAAQVLDEQGGLQKLPRKRKGISTAGEADSKLRKVL